MDVTITTNKGTSNLSGTVVVTATVTPAKQAVTPVRCDFYVDGGTPKASDTSYPLTFSWDTTLTGDGPHTLKADVVAGNRKRVTSLVVGVLNNPTPPPPPPPPNPPANLALPEINDPTPTEGQTLSVSNGDWTNSPTRYTYQWLRCDGAGANCVLIPSATSNSYVVVNEDVDDTLRCAVTAYNLQGASPAVQTAQTTAVSGLALAVPATLSPPIVTGDAVRGSALSTNTGTWSNFPTLYAYQWQRCDSAGNNPVNVGTSISTYTVQSADVGSTIRVSVIAANSAGNSVASGQSAPTALVTEPPVTPPSGLRYVYTIGEPNWNPTGTPGWWFDLVSSAGWTRDAAGQNATLTPQRIYYDDSVQVMQSVIGNYGNPGTSGPCRTVAVRIDATDPANREAEPKPQASVLRPYTGPPHLYQNSFFGPPPTAIPQHGETWWYGYAFRTNAAFKAHGQDVEDLTFGNWNSLGLNYHSSIQGGGGVLGPIVSEIATIGASAGGIAGPNGSLIQGCNLAQVKLAQPRLQIALTGGEAAGSPTDDATHTCKRILGPNFTAGTLYKVIYQVKWDAYEQGEFRWWVDSGSGYLQYANLTGVSTMWREGTAIDTGTYPQLPYYRKYNTSLPQCIFYCGGFIKGTTMAEVTIP